MKELNHDGLENDLIMQTITVMITLAIAFKTIRTLPGNASENQNDHSLKNSLISSDNDSEEQSIDGIVGDEFTACSTDDDS